MAGRRKLRRGIYLLPTSLTTGNLCCGFFSLIESSRGQYELAALLKNQPDKKEALNEIARLSDRVEQQRRALGSRGVSMKSAARAVTSSEALKHFSAKLQDGSYKSAAGELRKLSEQLKKGQLSPDAKEFEVKAT